MRFSLCCARPGCRRRTLPASVRFWGRRVYWAPVVLLVSALRQWRHPLVTLQRLRALCGVWRATVKRWQRYFRELFADSIGFRRLCGRLMPAIDRGRLPAALLERFCRNRPAQTALIDCLKALAMGP